MKLNLSKLNDVDEGVLIMRSVIGLVAAVVIIGLKLLVGMSWTAVVLMLIVVAVVVAGFYWRHSLRAIIENLVPPTATKPSRLDSGSAEMGGNIPASATISYQGAATPHDIDGRGRFKAFRRRRATELAADDVASRIVPLDADAIERSMVVYGKIHGQHWKQVITGSYKVVLVMLGIILLAVTYNLALAISDGARILMTGVVLVAVVVIVFEPFRQNYARNNTSTYVQGDNLVLKRPNKWVLGFFHGTQEIPLSKINAVIFEDQSLMESWFFKTVWTMTVDSASTEDKMFHRMRNVIDAKELGIAINVRKQLRHGN